MVTGWSSQNVLLSREDQGPAITFLLHANYSSKRNDRHIAKRIYIYANETKAYKREVERADKVKLL